jgi:hypothetical protein
MKARNKTLEEKGKYSYEWLYPEKIPNSISI